MIDFRNKLKERNTSRPISPIEIYERLDRSSSAAGPLRPIQVEILQEWFSHRFENRDLIVKLHTGQGKTLIGLLMLQAKLNAGKGPCLYVCPNIQLAEQAAKDAQKFGIPYSFLGKGEKYLPHDFENGKKILITYVQKVFNGKSIFHLDANGIQIGTFLLDDSHACIDAIRKSFSIEIARRDSLYNVFLEMFKHSLSEQAMGDYLKIVSSEYEQVVMAVPYWDWIRKNAEVLKALISADQDRTIFALPLLQNILKHCTMYITGSKIEITPDYMLTERFTSFSKASYRILMSATTQDDSFFIKGFGFTRETIEDPLTSTSTHWAGEKMVLFPTLIDDSISSHLIREFFSKEKKHRQYGVVSLVPSFWAAEEYYKECIKPKSSDLSEVILNLESGCFSKVVALVNRYDGIDLADNKCRVLILDSLPIFDSLAERYECNCRHGDQMMDVKIAQKVEQGLGRSVRSETDYSVILILGEELIRFIRSSKNNDYFSLQTRCQIRLGDDVTQMTKEETSNMLPLKALSETMKQCLQRDEGWKDYYKEQMNEMVSNATPPPSSNIVSTILIENEIENALRTNNILGACRKLKKLSDSCVDRIDKGWYQQILAKYTFLTSELDAEEIQYQAHFNNIYMYMPANYQYNKLGGMNKSRLQSIKDFINQFDNYNELKLYVGELIANMTFGVSAEKFEDSVMKLGLFLGFESQRPDLEYKKGPDNLWHSANGHFFLIECKNEVSLERKSINKEEVGQMSNHISWFRNNYPDAQTVSNIWIHPSNTLSELADINETITIITKDKLDSLKKQVLKFCGEFSQIELTTITDEFLQKLLKQYNFIESAFINTYTTILKKK